MMFRLIGNVGANLRDIGFAHRKSTVACLSGELGKRCSFGFNPFGRGLLYVFNRGADRNRSAQTEKKVDMVFPGIDEQDWASHIF